MGEYLPADKLIISAACDSQRTGEHAPSEKPVSSAACRLDRFLCPINRVLPSAGARAELTGSSVPSIGYALRRRPGFSIKYAGMNEISIG